MEQTPLNATDQAILIVGLFITTCAVSFTLWAIWLAARKRLRARRYTKKTTRDSDVRASGGTRVVPSISTRTC